MVQNDSWTVAAPFKEQKHVRTAVESIANNFSPQAQRLDIRKLPQAKQTTPYPGDGYYRGGKEISLLFSERSKSRLLSRKG